MAPADTCAALQLHLEDASNEFNLLLGELTEWKNAYRTCLVPRQVRLLVSSTSLNIYLSINMNKSVNNFCNLLM